jgi:regulator of cell morphogenesis and NO signaling
MIATEATLGELVAQRPARAAVFERLGLDFCCGGGRTLTDACNEQALDPATVAKLIDAIDLTPDPAPLPAESHDIAQASLTEICDHIVSSHHDRLRHELPQIADMIESIIRVHGPAHPWLHEFGPLFAHLWDSLEPHLEQEEQLLFPACRALDSADHEAPSIDEATIAEYEHDHQVVGKALEALSELTNGYDQTRALCRTHRRLLAALHALELDLHQHVHEENNILIPRLRTTLVRAASVPSETVR